MIFRNISSDTGHLVLQNDLYVLDDWCTTWLIPLNFSKSKTMYFSNFISWIKSAYTIKNQPVVLTSTYRQLWLHLQPCLSRQHHIAQMFPSANRSLRLLKCNLQQAAAQIRKLTYISLVRPKVEHGFAIWDPEQAYIIANIGSLRNRAVPLIYSEYWSFTSVTALKTSAELPQLSCRRKTARLSLLRKLCHHPIKHHDFFHKTHSHVSTPRWRFLKSSA